MDYFFGEILQDARKENNLTMRELARQIGVSAPYICDIEAARRIPAENVLEKLAVVLKLDFNELMARAARFDTRTERYMKRHPNAFRLLQKCAELELDESELLSLETYAERLVIDGRRPPISAKRAVS